MATVQITERDLRMPEFRGDLEAGASANRDAMTREQAMDRYMKIRGMLAGRPYEEQTILVTEALRLAREHGLVPPGYEPSGARASTPAKCPTP